MALAPYGYTIFCDDIRQESTGKLTFIGVYPATLYVHGEFPFTLSKFCFFIDYREPHDLRTESVALKIFLPGDADDSPSVEGEIHLERARSAMGEKIKDDSIPEQEKMIRATTVLSFAPVILSGEGVIKVRAYRGGKEEIRLGTLRVRQQKPPPKEEPPA